MAQQHLEGLNQLFDPLEVTTALLTGSTKPKERRVLEQLAAGEIDIIVGTHALIQERGRLAHLGLVITDEQHRFGVNRRKVLGKKAICLMYSYDRHADPSYASDHGLWRNGCFGDR